jgi:nucleotide-binding universal stress UspA family protein
MIKQILVPTDGSEYAMRGVRYAVSWARRHGAALHGIHVVDIRLLEGPFLRDVSATLGSAPFVQYQGNLSSVLEQRGEQALQAFREACEAAGVKADCALETGTVWRTIVEKSELMDLIVLGRGGEHNQFLEGLLGSTTEAVVRRARCPVLVTERDEAAVRRFIVAYDGTSHAKKALQTGADISETWGAPLDVLIVGETGKTAVEDEARSYLDAHGIKAEFVHREGDAGESIVAYARERDADLIVMGAYGHTKVRELVVGSTTAYTMNRAPCSVLLSR